MIEAVIFDIDGTLVDSVDLHAQAWQQALRHFGDLVDAETSSDDAEQSDRGSSASFDRQASAMNSVSFPGLFPPKVHKTVSFDVSFHQEAKRS